MTLYLGILIHCSGIAPNHALPRAACINALLAAETKETKVVER